ncbi:hypothetical protein C8Q76DRAFT_790905 [Earliella scabrosa]|nr:hypothetical protein C8Q76DRAFT_790905 [Earliella scabrosa]
MNSLSRTNARYGTIELASSLRGHSVAEYTRSCHAYSRAGQAFQFLQYIPWAGFSALRAYALSSNAALSCLIFALCTVPVVINAFIDPIVFGGSVVLSGLGCFGTNSEDVPTKIGCKSSEDVVFTSSSGLTCIVSVASRGSLIIADLLIIAITWMTLYRRKSEPLVEKHSLRHVLLRDGTVYFICLLTVNTLHLVLSCTSLAIPALAGSSYLGFFTEPLTTILMSRFMLDLQAVDKRNRDHSSTLGDLGSMQPVGNTWLSFQLVIGSMGSHMIGDFPTESSSIQQEHFGDSDADSPIVQGP